MLKQDEDSVTAKKTNLIEYQETTGFTNTNEMTFLFTWMMAGSLFKGCVG